MRGKPNKEDTKSTNKYLKLAPLLSRGELIVVNLYFNYIGFKLSVRDFANARAGRSHQRKLFFID